MVSRLAGVSVVTPAAIGLDLDVEETGSSFAENAAIKGEAFRAASGMVCVADDSGLEIDALGGDPGIYSARYGGPGLTDDDRNELVLSRLIDVPDEVRTARFVCAIAVAAPGRPCTVFEGTVEGRIARRAIGAHGFGYDPIFYFPPFGRTFGEVDAERKALVSHRGVALRKAAAFLRTVLTDDILGE